jgi:hypothetical protein
MSFESWLSECQIILVTALNFTEAAAAAMIHGAGISIYRAKFDRGLTPRQCVDDELSVWNE